MDETSIIENQGKNFDAYWETLDAKEQAYRDALADGLEAVLRQGAESLSAIAEGLNAINVHGPRGLRWTDALLESELERIAR